MPSVELPDVGLLEHRPLPLKTSWWVAPLDARVVHDCPLLMLSGVGLESWSLDIMHTWHLGPIQLLVSMSFNYCLDSGLWCPATHIDSEEKRKLGLLALKAELYQWYREMRKDPDWLGKGSEETWTGNKNSSKLVRASLEPCTQVWNLTLSMIGGSNAPGLHAKAAESHGLLLFVRYILDVHGPEFSTLRDPCMARKGKVLLEAATAALDLDVVFSSESRSFTRQESQRALGVYLRFLSFYDKAGGPWIPKCHLMIHLLQNTVFKGNPRLYSTYRDESFNGLIAKIARSCHRRTWHNIVHFKCQALHRRRHDALLKRLG